MCAVVLLGLVTAMPSTSVDAQTPPDETVSPTTVPDEPIPVPEPPGAPPYADPVPPDTSYVETGRRQVSLGVEHLTYRRASPLAQVHVARIAPAARTRLRAVASRDRVAGQRESVSSICSRTTCAAAINGDYWDTLSRPTGVFIADGELYQSPPPLHAQMSIDVNGTPTSAPLDWSVQLLMGGGQVVDVDAVNRAATDGQVVLYTARRGAKTGTPDGTRELVLQILEQHADGSSTVRIVDQRFDGNSDIPPGHLILAGRGTADAVVGELGTQAAQGNHTGVLQIDIGITQHAIGGSPRLMVDGRYDFPYQDARAATRQPRSAVGWTAGGEMLLVTVDGRQPGYSEGLDYPELAQLLAGLGAVEAIAFDGGGSTTFVVESVVQNRPSDSTGVRAVANALVVGPADVAASRLRGTDRYGTAVSTSRAAFPDGAASVTIASGENFPDALAGAPATVAGGGPLLLVGHDHLPAAVADELRRLGATDAAILGGPAAVSADVEAAIAALGIDTFRLAGPDRVATSVAISQLAFYGGAPVVYLATADAFPDALAAGAGAAAEGGPVLLVDGEALAPGVLTELRRLAPERIIVAGGTGAISEEVERQAGTIAPVFRRAGPDRYATAAEVARNLYPTAPRGVVATGLDFPDALAGAWLAGRLRQPLLLVNGDCTPEPAVRAADRWGTSAIHIVGGTAAVGPDVERLAVCAF